jgi:DNA-binding transcriptional regulator YdaS (Cro superfamily)
MFPPTLADMLYAANKAEMRQRALNAEMPERALDAERCRMAQEVPEADAPRAEVRPVIRWRWLHRLTSFARRPAASPTDRRGVVGQG